MTPKQMHSGLRIDLPIDKIRDKLQDAEAAIQDANDELLEAIGIAALSDIQQDYRIKARGGNGADGEPWAPIQVGTLLRRMRRVKAIGKLKPNDVKKTNEALKSSLAKKVGSVFRLNKANKFHDKTLHTLFKMGAIVHLNVKQGKGKAAHAVGSTFGINKGKKTNTVKETLRKTITPQAGGYEIGIDRGLQINTLQPGAVGNDGPNMTIQGKAVVIGAAMVYSEGFDKDRPIIPDPLPKAWMENYQEIAAIKGAAVVHVVFEKK
jgi:hypothetical protein